MKTCPACHHKEYEGEFFCSECGARLWEAGAEMPPTVTFNSQQLREKAVTGGGLTIPTVDFGQIALNIPGQPKPIMLAGRQEYCLGREAADQQLPDVNLAPFGAREKGVSRRHAALRVDRRQLLLMDLGSSNGTQLNGTPLVAQEPVRLENGDEIRLGKLAFKIYFNL